MCQMKVRISAVGADDLLIEDVTAVEARDGAVTVTSFFEPPRVFAAAAIQSIDCLRGTIVVGPAEQGKRT